MGEADRGNTSDAAREQFFVDPHAIVIQARQKFHSCESHEEAKQYHRASSWRHQGGDRSTSIPNTVGIFTDVFTLRCGQTRSCLGRVGSSATERAVGRL